MFKKSKIFFIILALVCSAFPASKVLFQGPGGDVNPPAVQSAGQDPLAAVGEAAGQGLETAVPKPAALSTAAADSGGASEGEDDKAMTVYFLDVGQADSIFIDFNSYEILVDGGNNGDGPRIADYIKLYIDGDLELIVATHAHEDHIGGLDSVIEAYQVDQIIYSGETSDTKTFQDFYEAAVSEPDCELTGDSDMTFFMGGGAQFKILEMGDGYRDPNENSVVSMIDYNDVEVLLTGDLQTREEKNNLTKFSDVDVLKVGHHGSKTSTSQAFLDVVKPEVSIISAGLDNQYKLPNKEVIERLHAIGSDVYGTFRSGTVVMTTDGVQYHFNTEIQLTPNDAGAPSTQ